MHVAPFTCRHGYSVRCRIFSVTWDLYIKLILRPWLKCRHGYTCSTRTCRSCVPDSSACGSVIHNYGIDNLSLSRRPRYSHTCLSDVGDAYWTTIWIYTHYTTIFASNLSVLVCIRWASVNDTTNFVQRLSVSHKMFVNDRSHPNQLVAYKLQSRAKK